MLDPTYRKKYQANIACIARVTKRRCLFNFKFAAEVMILIEVVAVH